ncbi:hypothetical protein E3T40_00860 [Cryobacterium sp. TMT1-19]|uniref:hypothetical protein n=1 Tax=Cryobacterium sp. TMT1-19 TaxID=1259231 RepID=UPI001068ECFF|nr:hypothetical protein [Cryobacterium sp. TMT1-19]TFD39638.1 hypothetical protein E3T40_00860 [Cryobacterium sp. TMT1-19]
MLTMAALLLCLLAAHTAGTGHGLAHGPGSLSSAPTAPASSSTTASTTMTTAMTADAHSAAGHTASSAAPLAASLPASLTGPLLERIAPATATVVALSAGALGSADTHAMSGLATLSMTCSLLLVLVGLILLARRPSACRRLLEAGSFIVGSFREIPLHLHRPRLTLLSIRRI